MGTSLLSDVDGDVEIESNQWKQQQRKWLDKWTVFYHFFSVKVTENILHGRSNKEVSDS